MTRILVIEDEAPLRENLVDMLEIEGVEADGVEDVQTGSKKGSALSSRSGHLRYF